jgi:hypothetical protein
MTAAYDGMLVVMVKMKTLTLFEDRLEPSAVSGAAHGQSQAGLDGAQDRDETAVNPVALSNVLNELLFADFRGTQEMVRSLSGGGPVLGFLKEALSQGLGVLGEVNQPDFGGTQIRPHPLRREQRTEAGVEAKAIPPAQGALDQRAKLIHKTFGNEVFR